MGFLAKMSVTFVLYVWMPLAFLGVGLAVAYLGSRDLNNQYLALWCLVLFTPSFWAWRSQIWKPWTKSRQIGSEK